MSEAQYQQCFKSRQQAIGRASNAVNRLLAGLQRQQDSRLSTVSTECVQATRQRTAFSKGVIGSVSWLGLHPVDGLDRSWNCLVYGLASGRIWNLVCIWRTASLMHQHRHDTTKSDPHVPPFKDKASKHGCETRYTALESWRTSPVCGTFRHGFVRGLCLFWWFFSVLVVVLVLVLVLCCPGNSALL